MQRRDRKQTFDKRGVELLTLVFDVVTTHILQKVFPWLNEQKAVVARNSSGGIARPASR